MFRRKWEILWDDGRGNKMYDFHVAVTKRGAHKYAQRKIALQFNSEGYTYEVKKYAHH